MDSNSSSVVVVVAAAVCFALCLFPHDASAAPVVKLLTGIAQGRDEKAVITASLYHAYYGLPFAQPPVGNLRFQRPRAFVAQDPGRVITSDGFRDACAQISSPSTEDCLYLNVFTPLAASGQFSPASRRKVMVWIHGGTYTSGDASKYPPSRLVTDYDVIVVTTQYRLGPFGFLSSGDEVLPGNNGLYDQIMALQWVKDNIQSFGGDPDDVTLFGQSAGASSASILALSPLTKGLFTKVILQSGTALAPWTLNRKPEKTFLKIAQLTKCLPWFYFPGLRKGYNQRIVRCLQELSPLTLTTVMLDEIVQAVVNFDIQAYSAYSPMVDGNLLPKDPFVLIKDAEYLRDIGALDRKYMVGVTNNEGILVINTLRAVGYSIETILQEPTAQQALRSTMEDATSFPITSDIFNFASLTYLYPRTWDHKVKLQGLIDLFSDTNFVIPTMRLASALVKASSQVDLYLYLFDHYPELKRNDSVFQGSEHGLDVLFVFDERFAIEDFLSSYAKVWTSSAKSLSGIMRSTLTNMAKTGSPSLKGQAQWPRFDLQDQSYLAISTSPEVRHGLYERRVSFWTDFLPGVTDAILSLGPRDARFRV